MPRGKHREGYRRPRMGDRRAVRQPFKADRISESARAVIQEARAGRCGCEKRRAHFHTWEEIPGAVKRLTGEEISRNAAQRWYDVRIEQVNQEVMAQAEASRQLAAEFARAGQALPEATVNALSAEVFAVLQAGTPEQRQKALGALLFLQAKLIDAQAKQKRAEIEGRKLKFAEKRFEDLKAKADKATNEAADKLGKGKQLTLDDINRLRRTVFGLDPAPGHPA